MAGRQMRPNRMFNMAMEGVWRQADQNTVLSEREAWRGDRQRVLDENTTLKTKLSVTEEENQRLRAELQKAREELGLREEKWQEQISQLNRRLLQKDKELRRAVAKRRARCKAHLDTLALLTQTQAALEKSKQRSGSLEEDVDQQLREQQQLHQKEVSDREESSREELSEQAAEIHHQLPVREDSLKKQLSHQRASFQRELSVRSAKSSTEKSTLSDSFHAEKQQSGTEKTALVETVQTKSGAWRQREALRKADFHRLNERRLQLQTLRTLRPSSSNPEAVLTPDPKHSPLDSPL